MAGLNSNTKLLLHCDGADAGTTFTDSSFAPHTVTANGNAQTSTTTPKFGTACALFDGTGDYLDSVDSADWDCFASNADNWTIDFWIKYTSATGAPAGGARLMNQWEGNNDYWTIHQTNGGTYFYLVTGGSVVVDASGATTISDDSQHHLALVKKANEYALYLDGTQISYVQDDDVDTYAYSLWIGARQDGAGSPVEALAGRMDEIRIQHSNYFNASPNVGVTDTITVPTSAYSKDVGGNPMFFSSGGVTVG